MVGIFIFNFVVGIVVSGISVVISMIIVGVMLYYILDGSEFGVNLMEYIFFVVFGDGNWILKVIGVLEGYQDSMVVSVDYIVGGID